MTYLFKILPARGLMFERWEGRFGAADDLWAALQRSANHPDYRPGLDIVADFTGAELDIPYRHMLSFVRRARADHNLDTGRSAMIVASPLERGMVRMYQMLAEESGPGVDLRICETFEEAREWLGLPESIEEPGREEMVGG